jgi:hypothetical protein
MLHSSLRLGKHRSSIDTHAMHSNGYYDYDGDEEGLLNLFTDTHDSKAATGHRHSSPFVSQLRQSVMGVSHIMDHSPFTVQVVL